MFLKWLIIGTPLEPFARRLHARFTTAPGKADTYALHTLEVMYETLNERSNVIDIGAHTGSVLRWVTRLAPLGMHTAFEPIPALYESLCRQYPNVDVRRIALSDRTGEASFLHVVNIPAFSGFHKQAYYPKAPVIEELRVPTARLDDIVPESASVDFIKIDVEGAELQVLRGASQTIARTQPVIVCEHEVNPAARPEEVYDLLRQCGLRVFRMADWLAGEREGMTAQLFKQLYGSGVEWSTTSWRYARRSEHRPGFFTVSAVDGAFAFTLSLLLAGSLAVGPAMWSRIGDRNPKVPLMRPRSRCRSIRPILEAAGGSTVYRPLQRSST